MLSVNRFRLYTQIVINCENCPALMCEKNKNPYCERTGFECNDQTKIMENCPLEIARPLFDENCAVTYDEKLMLTASTTMDEYN